MLGKTAKCIHGRFQALFVLGPREVLAWPIRPRPAEQLKNSHLPESFCLIDGDGAGRRLLHRRVEQLKPQRLYRCVLFVLHLQDDFVQKFRCRGERRYHSESTRRIPDNIVSFRTRAGKEIWHGLGLVPRPYVFSSVQRSAGTLVDRFEARMTERIGHRRHLALLAEVMHRNEALRKVRQITETKVTPSSG